MPGLESLKAELPSYIIEMKRTKSQPGKEIIFTRFIERVFGITPEAMTMEVPVTSKVFLVRGRVDAVFGNLLLEFKVDLRRELEDAEVELKKYFQAFYETAPSKPYLGIANDGIVFKVYQPSYSNDPNSGNQAVSSIRLIDSLDLENEMSLERIFLWFDSYLFVSQKATPTSEDIKKRFGTDSPTFYTILSEFDSFYDTAMKFRHNRVKYDSWARTLEIVYGDRVDSKLLFIKHTYLATLAKLLVHLIIIKPKAITKSDIRAIVYGDIFSRYGISNFIEEDFYTWILDKSIRENATDAIYSLMKELMIYDLDKVDEDFLKSLYEQLVDPEVRHDLGEYYTPDWLAQYIVKETIPSNPAGSMLDPACGSGTFLFTAIKEKIASLQAMKKTSPEILEHITGNVVGADVHPLAVIIARTNYLLAIRSLLQERGQSSVSIPVYLCDTLRIPRISVDIGKAEPEYKVLATEGVEFAIPSTIIDNPQELDLMVDLMGGAAREYEKVREDYSRGSKSLRNTIEKGFQSTLRRKTSDSNVIEAFSSNLTKLLDLIEIDANSIWSFILKNVYKPVTLSDRRFDFVLGNPPWLTLRQMKDSEYQDFLKKTSRKLGLVDSSQAHLISLIELASLFFVSSLQNYLNDTGTIAFVMPKGVMVAGQHEGFRKLLKGHVESILDLEYVKPLFNTASCAIIAQKRKSSKEPQTLMFKGLLPRRNATWTEAKGLLTITNIDYQAPETITKERPSYYHEKFHLGASIQPRRFWCVEFQKHDVLGPGSSSNPAIASDTSLDTKPPWSKVMISGSAEAQFIFATATGNDFVPFGILRFRPLLLPVILENNHLRVEKREELSRMGYTGVAQYLKQAEDLWAALAQSKSKQMTIYQRLDYMRGISNQNPKAPFKVIYGASGTNLAAVAIDQSEGITVDGVKARSFIADKKTYFCDLNDKNEAHYLEGVLNSNHLNSLIKPLQSRGLWGARDIHKRPLLFPIPRFDRSNPNHRKIAELAQGIHEDMSVELPGLAKYGVSRARILAKSMVSKQIAEIDVLTREFLPASKEQIHESNV